jgi:predicted metalloprotease
MSRASLTGWSTVHRMIPSGDQHASWPAPTGASFGPPAGPPQPPTWTDASNLGDGHGIHNHPGGPQFAPDVGGPAPTHAQTGSGGRPSRAWLVSLASTLTFAFVVALGVFGSAVPGAELTEDTSGRSGSQRRAETQSHTATDAARGEHQDAIVSFIRDIDEFWQRTYPEVYSETYRTLEGGVVAATPTASIPDCGTTEVNYRAVRYNAFYCFTNDMIVYDAVGLFPALQSAHGTGALGAILAHEWGHAIQQRQSLERLPAITLEQQADCFAGAWLADAVGRQTVDDADALGAVVAILQLRDTPGIVSSDPHAHGSAFDRLSALRDGWSGGAGRCAGYADSPPVTFQLPWVNASDYLAGGNLPLEALLPLLEADLRTRWGAQGPEAIVEAGRGPCDPGDEVAVWCAADNTVTYRKDRAERLVAKVGDFAAATVIADAWHRGVSEQLGTNTNKSPHPECLTGGWTRELIEPNTPDRDFALSPGDLDELAVVVLATVAKAGGQVVDAFSQLELYRTGLVGGTGSC